MNILMKIVLFPLLWIVTGFKVQQGNCTVLDSIIGIASFIAMIGVVLVASLILDFQF